MFIMISISVILTTVAQPHECLCWLIDKDVLRCCLLYHHTKHFGTKTVFSICVCVPPSPLTVNALHGSSSSEILKCFYRSDVSFFLWLCTERQDSMGNKYLISTTSHCFSNRNSLFLFIVKWRWHHFYFILASLKLKGTNSAMSRVCWLPWAYEINLVLRPEVGVRFVGITEIEDEVFPSTGFGWKTKFILAWLQ